MYILAGHVVRGSHKHLDELSALVIYAHVLPHHRFTSAVGLPRVSNISLS
jgi:hypothetical protein